MNTTNWMDILITKATDKRNKFNNLFTELCRALMDLKDIKMIHLQSLLIDCRKNDREIDLYAHPKGDSSVRRPLLSISIDDSYIYITRPPFTGMEETKKTSSVTKAMKIITSILACEVDIDYYLFCKAQ